jgi:pimeloyl-ACP methyl ester carboxylesterase
VSPNEPYKSIDRLDSRDRDVRARSGMLYTRDAGRGEAVVLIHEFPLNGRMWEPQIEGLRKRYRLIAPDLAGFGLSAARGAGLSLADHARDVLNAVNLLGIERVTVVGLGVGGFVALHLVEELGARLQGLLLVSTSLTPDAPEVANWCHELAAEVEMRGVDAVADAFLPKLLGTTSQRHFPEMLDSLRLMVQENTPAGVAGVLRAMAARHHISADLHHIHCPVLCVGGEDDVLTPSEEIVLTAERIPALMQIIPEVGHLPNLEAPEVFNDSVVRLLATCTPA